MPAGVYLYRPSTPHWGWDKVLHLLNSPANVDGVFVYLAGRFGDIYSHIAKIQVAAMFDNSIQNPL